MVAKNREHLHAGVPIPKRALFLKTGKLLQKPPTWAFLVDGGLNHVAKTETLPRMGHQQGDVCRAVEVEHVLRVYDRCGGGDPWRWDIVWSPW